MRLDRYLFFQLVRSTVLGSLIAVAVLLSLQILRLADQVIRYEPDMISIVQIMAGLCQSFTPLVFPISFLFAMLGVFGRMSSDREFVALASMGHSPRRILLPCLAFGLVMTAATLYVGFEVGPHGNQRFERAFDDAVKRRVKSVLQSGTFSEEFLGMVVFVDQVDPAMQNLQRVFIHDETSFKEHVSISAKSGEWIQSMEDSVGTLSLKDGILVSQVPEKKIVRRIHFSRYDIHTDFTHPAGTSHNAPPSWDARTLLEQRKHTTAPGIEPRSIWVEIARRCAVAFACLFFVPLAYAISLDFSRTARNRGVFTGLTILLCYWTLYFGFVTWLLKTPFPLAHTSEALSWVVMWVPNAVVLVASAFFYWRRVKTRSA